MVSEDASNEAPVFTGESKWLVVVVDPGSLHVEEKAKEENGNCRGIAVVHSLRRRKKWNDSMKFADIMSINHFLDLAMSVTKITDINEVAIQQ